MGSALRVGVVGAGYISAQYSEVIGRLPQLALTAVADLDPTRAASLAAGHAGASVRSVAELVDADDVDVVLNLTLPATHAAVSAAALAAGKHVYSEKPLATSVAEGTGLVAAAAAASLRIGCAPDTVLGTGVQTARAVIDAGEIGRPHSATAVMTTPGHERWHPAPDFYYQPGGGPLLDMGPYYLSALIHLLGPIERVVGTSSRPQAQRTIGSGPRTAESFEVAIDSHVAAILEHTSGALTTMIMSFDTWATHIPPIEVHGTRGSLAVPDPNWFGGRVELFTADVPEWVDVGVRAGYAEAGRGYGIADLALAIDAGRPHRADVQIALHVLDVMESVQRAAATGASVAPTTTCTRPAAVEGLIDLTH